MAPNTNKNQNNEDRIKRLLDAKKKYNEISKAKTRIASKADAQKAGPARKVTNLQPAKPALVGRNSVRSSTATSSRAQKLPERRTVSNTVNSRDDDEFESDSNSLAMLKSNRPIPARAFPRVNIGRKSRVSVVAERPSMLPMGINIFNATQEQKNLVREKFLNSGKESLSAPPSVVSTTTTRTRVIRFEETIEEQRESVEAAQETTSNVVEPKSILRNSQITATPSSRRTPRMIVPTKSKLCENLLKAVNDIESREEKTTEEDVKLLEQTLETVKRILEQAKTKTEPIPNENEELNSTLDDSSQTLPVLQGSIGRIYKPIASGMFRNVAIIEDDEENEEEEEEERVKPRRQSRRLSKVMPVLVEPKIKRRSSRMFKKH